MLYFVDCTSPPTAAVARTLYHNGWKAMCCYIGGPRAAAGHSGWSNTSVRLIAASGMRFLPTYVGRT